MDPTILKCCESKLPRLMPCAAAQTKSAEAQTKSAVTLTKSAVALTESAEAQIESTVAQTESAVARTESVLLARLLCGKRAESRAPADQGLLQSAWLSTRRVLFYQVHHACRAMLVCSEAERCPIGGQEV